MKGLVYMTIPNYMTISGKDEYLEITHGSNFNDLVSELAKLKHRISYTTLFLKSSG
jgi:DNA polymerase II small subunit/DNA polymerase delta subunit B